MAFDWFQFSQTSGAPWRAEALAIVWPNFLVAFTIDGAAFLAMFAGAVWLSHRSPDWRSGMFALAGSIAMIAPYVVLGFNLDFLALTWWPWRVAEVAIGAVAGVAFYYIARQAKGAPPVAA
jgi:hypothetical protein